MYYAGKSKETREAWRVDRGEQALDLMDRVLQDREWLAADHLTIADISLVAYTRIAAEGGFDLTGQRHLTGWIERCERALSIDPVT